MLQYTSSCIGLTVGLSFPMFLCFSPSPTPSLVTSVLHILNLRSIKHLFLQPSFRLGWGGRGRAAWALFGAEQIYVFRFSLALAIDQVCCYSSCIRSFFCSSQQLFQNCIYPDIPEFERMHGPQCSLQRY